MPLTYESIQIQANVRLNRQAGTGHELIHINFEDTRLPLLSKSQHLTSSYFRKDALLTSIPLLNKIE